MYSHKIIFIVNYKFRKYKYLTTVVTSSGVSFSGSVRPMGDMFKVGFGHDSAGGHSYTGITGSYITDVKKAIDYYVKKECLALGGLVFNIIFLVKFFNPTCGINQILLSSKERMRFIRNF